MFSVMFYLNLPDVVWKVRIDLMTVMKPFLNRHFMAETADHTDADFCHI